MKIGIDIRLIGKDRTGDEVVFFNLVKNIAEIDRENEYILLTDICKKEKLKKIINDLGLADKNNFKIISLETGNKYVWNFWTLPKYLRKNPVDIYHTQYITPFLVPKKIKIITIIHDISFNFFPKFIKKKDLFFLKALIPLSIKRADIILGVSKFTRDEIINYYNVSSEKVDYIYNAADARNTDRPTSDELKAIRKKYKLPKKFIMYMGTMQPRKNIPFLIECYAKIKNKIPQTKLVLCGNRKSHNYDLAIDEAISKHKLDKDVYFSGFIEKDDKYKVYSIAHTYVFPSLYEGFGIPMLEAFASGVPVLASDIPSLREIGDEAAIFGSPSNLDKFAKSLYDISVDQKLRESLVNSGYTQVKLFSWKKTAEKVINIYNKLK